MMKAAKHFLLSDESGAVTVDWVVLTAAIVGMAILVLTPIAYGTDSVSQGTANYITSVQVGYGNNP